ncbi:MAG TPA: DUF5667 domain-containing protein [Anaerolineae bacterium]|nr:DUF5667 domain-containing protein [Anaerolineae bacterium]HMR64403.1 DUF5667 domain-containing protein [Anaerolineae bacterium]
MRNDELTQTQIDKLEDALAMVAAGVPLEEVLAQAGPDAGWLRPMLILAGEVEALGEAIAVPLPDVSLQRLLAHGNALRREERLAPRPVEPQSSFFQSLRQLLFRGGLSVATVAALVAVLCLLGGTVGGGLVLAAENSLPGQALYPVKRLGETIRLRLADDEQDRQRLEDSFSTLRRQEVEQLLDRNWPAEVVLTGQVQSFSATKLVVAQFEVRLTPETNLVGELGVGAKVRIEGETDSAGQLTAGTVTVIEPPPPTPTPTPVPPTPSPTSTSSPTATPAFKATSDTLIIEPTSTPLAQPTGAGSDNDNNRPEEDDDRSDNSGSGSDNSGRGSDSNRNENNSGSDNDNIEREDDEPKVPPDNSDDNDNQSNEAPKPDETPKSEDNANTNDNVDFGNDDSGSSDNSGSGSDNSGSGNNSGGGDNDNNSGSGSDNPNSGSNSGGGDNDNNSGSDSNGGSDNRSDNDSGDDDDDE